jgi:hypothetical protein
MAYTKAQRLRKFRAKRRDLRLKLASVFRDLATMSGGEATAGCPILRALCEGWGFKVPGAPSLAGVAKGGSFTIFNFPFPF